MSVLCVCGKSEYQKPKTNKQIAQITRIFSIIIFKIAEKQLQQTVTEADRWKTTTATIIKTTTATIKQNTGKPNLKRWNYNVEHWQNGKECALQTGMHSTHTHTRAQCQSERQIFFTFKPFFLLLHHLVLFSNNIFELCLRQIWRYCRYVYGFQSLCGCIFEEKEK